MKHFMIICAAALSLYACTSNDAKSTHAHSDSAGRAQLLAAAGDTANFTSIQWIDSTSQNMGSVKEGQTVEVSWRFKNTGTKPLIIANATASCGCTVAEKPEAPIGPGSEGVIKAKFDSHGRSGPQNKEVYVEANTGESRTHRLTFALEVQK